MSLSHTTPYARGAEPKPPHSNNSATFAKAIKTKHTLNKTVLSSLCKMARTSRAAALGAICRCAAVFALCAVPRCEYIYRAPRPQIFSSQDGYVCETTGPASIRCAPGQPSLAWANKLGGRNRVLEPPWRLDAGALTRFRRALFTSTVQGETCLGWRESKRHFGVFGGSDLNRVQNCLAPGTAAATICGWSDPLPSSIVDRLV